MTGAHARPLPLSRSGSAGLSRVVCLGDLMVDVLARLPGPLTVGSDTPAPISLLSGGSAANTAAWLVEAGTPATFVGRVGDDTLGRLAREEMTAAGIDLAVSIDPVRPTGTCIVLVDADGERTMVPAAGANCGLGEEALPAELIAPGVHLHVSGYAVFNSGSRSAATRAVELARARGCPVSVDASSSAPLHAFGPENFLGWLGPALLFANRDEAAVLAGSDDVYEAATVLGARCGEAIVKCGAAGAVWSDGTGTLSVPADPVDVIDSTGAGDAFAAGVLAARLRGADVLTCLRAGVALAARALGRVGARPSTQDRL